MIAHKRKSDGKEQSLAEHSRHTARLCGKNAARFGLEKTGQLIGLLHDLGKATAAFAAYLREQFEHPPAAKGQIHHAPSGAIFAFERWYNGTASRRAAAQIIAMVIYGHHSGLMDAIDLNGDSPLLRRLGRDKEELHYDEAVDNFLSAICSLEELNSLFDQAEAELQRIQPLLSCFFAGLTARSLLACLVDADRWDSACFEYGEDPFTPSPAPDWSAAQAELEAALRRFPIDTPLAKIRNDISRSCFVAAKQAPGIFSLTVPTGGGKTLSSLRFALEHARRNSLERVFYVIPYNTVLDQNAKDIRQALGNSVDILEHHSNIVFEDENREEEYADYRLLTQRWDADIILTSMVRFLNACYRGENSETRRLCSLARSVIIFDEIQALPKHCTRLFEKAVEYLVQICGCTVVLCTATQPQLNLKATELAPHGPALFSSLRRTRLIDEGAISKTDEQAASDILKLVDKHGPVLMIVNTKAAAKRLYDLVRDSGVSSMYLTTELYPEHRTQRMRELKNRAGKGPFFCVSTAMIEAGVNISFPCVVRSLAGLSSILQAAGRCNRHAELPAGALGEVHIWHLSNENLKHLPEIEKAQGCARGVLAAGDPESPAAMTAYFANERQAFENELDYPVNINGVDVNLVKILGLNRQAHDDEVRRKLCLWGAYATAGREFQVIAENTQTVLVAHGQGESICSQLAGSLPLAEKRRLLRQGQRFSVSLFPHVFAALASQGAIWRQEDSGVYVLRREFYHEETGVIYQPQLMDFQLY